MNRLAMKEQQQESPATATATATSGVSSISDSAALEALLSSAHKHEESKMRRSATSNANRNHSHNKNNNKNDNKNGQQPSWKRKVNENEDSAMTMTMTTTRRPRKSRWGSRNDSTSSTSNLNLNLIGSASTNNQSNRTVTTNNKGPTKAEVEAGASSIVEKEKPNFAVSDALAKDSVQRHVSTRTTTTTTKDGVTVTSTSTTVSKYSEPPEARIPNTQWRLYVFSSSQSDSDDPIATWHMSKQSAYIFGRDDKLCDVPLTHHPSVSKQHAVLQYRFVNQTCTPYILDLQSTNGTYLNQIRLDPARYYELKRGDVLRFGNSARDFVLLTEHSKKSKLFS